MRRRTLAVGPALIVALATGAAAQETEPPERTPLAFPAEVERVTVDVVVVDKQGQPVRSLTQADFEIYEGAVDGAFTSHLPRLCSTGGATMAALHPSAGNTYYLVVPRNATSEGSYGLRSDGSERPPGVPACYEQALGGCD